MTDNYDASKENNNKTTKFFNFIEFAKIKKLKFKCNVCGHEEFSYDENANSICTPLINKETWSLQLDQAVPIYWISCSNCGHILFFHKNIIENFLIEHLKEK